MGRFNEGDLERLVDRARRGDGDAWAALVDRFQMLVYSTARRYRLGEDDAADVFQTTFQSLLRSLDRIESGQALPKWLAVTAARESLRIKRIQARSTDLDSQGITLDEIIANEEADAEETAVAMDRALALRQGVAAMADKCRRLLEMLYLEETPYTEVAERMPMPVGAIGPTKSRCLEKLRVILARSGFFE